MTRIIAGEWRGHSLPRLSTGTVRPTTDRARTVLFDTLRDVTGFRVLDLYSGTGALGFEALSRGAKSVVSIDYDRKYIQEQKSWIKDRNRSFRAYHGDVEKVLKRLDGPFELIFADPPYDSQISDTIQRLVEGKIVSGGIFVYERDKKSDSPFESDIFKLVKEKIVAQTKLEIYKAQ